MAVDSLITGVGSYDQGIGIDPVMIDYVVESHALQVEISHHRCYLLQRRRSLPVTNTQTVSAWEQTLADGNHCVARIWDTGSLGNLPDLRPTAEFHVSINGTGTTRVLDYRDLLSDREFTVYQDRASPGEPVYLVFNPSYAVSAQVVTYSHAAVVPHYVAEIDTPDFHNAPDRGSIYGWDQWTGSTSNAIKVRLPMSAEQLVPDELGRLTLRDSQCWMLPSATGSNPVPFVYNHDVLVVPATSVLPKRLFLIYDKEDSEIQGRNTHQRFRVQYIDGTDVKYQIPVIEL